MGGGGGDWRSRKLGVAERRNLWRFLKNNPHQLFYTSQLLKNPQLSFYQHHFPSKDILLLQIFQPAKNLPEEQTFWETDPLGAPVLLLSLFKSCYFSTLSNFLLCILQSPGITISTVIHLFAFFFTTIILGRLALITFLHLASSRLQDSGVVTDRIL